MDHMFKPVAHSNLICIVDLKPNLENLSCLLFRQEE